MDEYVVTRAGLEKLQTELEHLRAERVRVSDRIREARSLGDLRENFDYQDAKRQGGIIQGRIDHLEKFISRATVVEEAPGAAEAAGLNTVVTVYEVELEDEAEEYHLVGAAEASAMENKISILSPLGRALQGKRPGDEAEVETPDGDRIVYVVKAVRPA